MNNNKYVYGNYSGDFIWTNICTRTNLLENSEEDLDYLNGLNIGINTFGESGPGNDVADHFGIVPEKVATRIRNHMKL